MKNLRKYSDLIREWLDSPGSIDVPGQNSEIRVNSRNYTPAHQPPPVIADAMYEKSYFNDFLDEQGKSEHFNRFIGEGKKSASEITNYIKGSFEKKTSEEKKK